MRSQNDDKGGNRGKSEKHGKTTGPVARKRSLKAIAIRMSITTVISGVLAVVVFRVLLRDTQERFNYYAAYSYAFHEYYELHGEDPPDIRSMEEAYNTSGNAESPLPPPAPFERPEYRSIAGLSEGEYILFVEPPSPRWYSLMRTVIYGSTDGDTRVVAEPRTKVDALLAEDDARRGAKR